MKKKRLSLLLAVVLLLSLLSAQFVYAVETGAEDTTVYTASEQITVPIRISDNPGFTNFGIALDYDRDALTLVSLNTADDTSPHLCGELAAVNTAWESAKDTNAATNTAFTAGQTYGYVTCASAEAVTEDGILFTATFEIDEDFSGTAEVTPLVSYIRSEAAVVTATVEADAVTVEGEGAAVMLGDVNQDGYITADDAAEAFAASINSSKLADVQKLAADVNQDGYITADDAAAIFAMSYGTQSGS